MILSALERGDAHGFEVLRRLEDGGCGIRLKEGSLDPALYRLEGSGLIRGEWEDGAMMRRGPRGASTISRKKERESWSRVGRNGDVL